MILDIQNLRIETQRGGEQIEILRGIDLQIPRGKIIGLVGESGCGKSMLSLAIMQLLSPQMKVTSGKIIFQQKNLLESNESQMAQIRGADVSMIFQDAMSALNPMMTVQEQIEEALILQTNLNEASRIERVVELLSQVGIQAPRDKMKSYPHELSGGLAQRVMIAMAMSCQPQLLIADEPTTALDVTLQSQILDLLVSLQKTNQMSILLISHDLALISQYADEIHVMYSGEIVEQGPAEKVINFPEHPYSQGLIQCLPSKYDRFDLHFRLPTIRGQVRSFRKQDNFCLFHERCPSAREKCRNEKPQTTPKCFFPLRSSFREGVEP
jgi:oligopeptide/dipeptide ABC transporter ATP-binding protein